MLFFFFFKQKTAYEMRISDWSSDVCSSDLGEAAGPLQAGLATAAALVLDQRNGTLAAQMDALPDDEDIAGAPSRKDDGRDAVSEARPGSFVDEAALEFANGHGGFAEDGREYVTVIRDGALPPMPWLNVVANPDFRSEEHTSEL